MVNAVCIVPEDTEIFGCRLQRCKTADGFVRISVALRVGIFRHTPDTFDGIILCHQFFYQIHIRSFRSHRNIDHLDSEILGDREMAVISRYRTQEFHFVQFGPWCTSCDTVCIRTCNRIEHYRQAGISIYDHLVWLYLTDIGEQFFRLRNTCQKTVIAAVGAVLCIYFLIG